MERHDFWYPAEAESLGGIPTGTRAGQFLFLSTQTPINLDTGQVIRRLEDLPPEEHAKVAMGNAQLDVDCGPIRAQTWTIYQNLSKILAQQGSSLENIIHQRIYLTDKTDTRHMEEVMLSFFPDYKPTTMIAAVPNRGLHDGICIMMDAIALIPQDGGLQKEAIFLPELEAVTAPYPQAVRVGQFLFMGEMMGINPETGRVVTSLADLDYLGPDAPKTRTGRVHSDHAQGALNAQWWLIWKYFQRVLESQGAGLGDFLTANGYVRSSMKELHMREPLRIEFFKGRADWSPGGAVPCLHDLSVIPEVDLIFGAVALAPGEYRVVKGERMEFGVTYSDWGKAGPLFFFAGTGALDPEKKRSILSFADISDKGRWLAHGRIDDNQIATAKAWFTYQRSIFARMPFKPSQVVHQTVHLRNPSDWPAVERVAQIVFEGRIPATTVVPVDSMGFYFRDTPTPELLEPLRMEIQLEGIVE